ncbi:30S ribosomal protein S10 [Candidatus Vidania fulgoroideorum]
MILRILINSYSKYHIFKFSEILILTFKKLRLTVKGPIFIPKKRTLFNILRSPHIDKDSRDQICVVKSTQIFYIYNLNKEVLETLLKINVPSMVRIYFRFL